ncbi:MAG: hypothetical protein ACOC6F_04210 [bacterium]
MDRCTRCVLPASYPGITFDEEGVCTYCRAHVRREYLGESRLREVVDRYRRSDGSYDCIVGLSGGRDSSYLLHYAVKELDLNVLAYTVDNGFIPDQTKLNIRRMTDLLDVDHITERQNYTRRCIRPFLRSWIRRPSAAMLSSMCVGCRMAMALGFLRKARDYEIPLLLTGGGEPEMSFATGFLTMNSADGKSNSLLAGYLREMRRNPAYLLSPAFVMTALAEYVCYFSNYSTVKRLIYPAQKYVPLFHYVEWDEEEIVSVITNELDWENYSHSQSTWRSDCKIGLLKNYLYGRTAGFTKHDELLSGMIREGMIDRPEALRRVANENVSSERFLVGFLGELGLDRDRLENALRGIQPDVEALRRSTH